MRLADQLHEWTAEFRSRHGLDVRKLYGEWEQAHLRRLVRHFDVDCIFDVGANFGQYAQMIRHKVSFDGLLISFEPNPVAAAALRKRARGQSNWLIEEVAIGPTDGTATFNIMHDSEFSSLSTPRHDDVDIFEKKNRVDESVEVRTENLATTLERLRSQHGFQRPFLKLDTQGLDVQIVTSAPEAVRQFIGLQSELAVKRIYADSVDFREAISAYEDCGFQLSAFVPNNDGHFPHLVEMDCIMVRDDLVS
jgi:FkbM family methyltransferase